MDWTMAVEVFAFGFTGVFVCLSILALAIKLCGVFVHVLARVKRRR